MKKTLRAFLFIGVIWSIMSSAHAATPTYCLKEQASLSPNVCALYDKGIDAYNDKKFEQAEVYFKGAKVYATYKWEIEYIDTMLELITDEYMKKTAPSNDTYSHKQYYLKTMNIPTAWTGIPNPKQVVVAVIDDWLDISQPDLIDSIWVDPSASYWASKVKDFVGDKLTNYASGEHGTMVAGIIWASTNNSLWIAGIAKNVKIMPLRVFPMTWSGWAKEENIINAMNYAIDNGANIINLSLGKSQFAYSANFDAVIKKAASKNIITVIAAGNWDAYTSWAKGLDLSISPISPVCNNGGKDNKLSIWVGSIDKEWRKSEWSNFGNCVNFWAPGEDIVSTSIPLYSDGYRYDIKNGTSFSAPIIAGIVALWYNKYGSTSPEIVFDSLTESLSDFNYSTDNASFTKLKDRTQTVDAAKYLEILGRKIAEAAMKKPATTEVKPVVPATNTKKPLTYFESLAASGVISTQSTESGYRLGDQITRAEIVKIAIKLSGKTTVPCSGKIYGDVSDSIGDLCWYVEAAAQAGMVSKNNSKFRPSDLVTKAEMIKIILAAKNVQISQISAGFKDVSASMGDLAGYINTAATKGYITKTDFFLPNTFAMRSEVFQLAYKLMAQ